MGSPESVEVAEEVAGEGPVRYRQLLRCLHTGRGTIWGEARVKEKAPCDIGSSSGACIRAAEQSCG